MGEKKSYTAENPYKVFKPLAEIGETAAKFDDWCANRGGVAVWDKALIEAPYGQQVVTPALDADGTPTKCPGWQWAREPSCIITERTAVVVVPLAVTKLVTREYMPLDLFTLAVASVDVGALTVSDTDPDGSEVTDIADPAEWLETMYDEAADDGNAAKFHTVRIAWDRAAYDGNGHRVGYEEYVVTLPVVPRDDHDDGPAPNRLSQWLVRVDAFIPELLSHPDEPTVVWGYMTQDAGFLPHGDELEDTSWMRGAEVDGEFLTEEEFDRWDGGYYAPEDNFVYEEGAHRVRRVIEVGAHYSYDHDLKKFVVLDAYGVRLDD